MAILRLAPDPADAAARAEAAFLRLRTELAAVLPPAVLIEHVGATAVPSCLTKGDLDVAVRASLADFDACLAQLGARFAVNEGSVRTEAFAAFADDAADPPLGIQLCVVGSELDLFVRFRDRLSASPDLVGRYNALKAAHVGRAMDDYRTAKAAFIHAVLSGNSPG